MSERHIFRLLYILVSQSSDTIRSEHTSQALVSAQSAGKKKRGGGGGGGGDEDAVDGEEAGTVEDLGAAKVSNYEMSISSISRNIWLMSTISVGRGG